MARCQPGSGPSAERCGGGYEWGMAVAGGGPDAAAVQPDSTIAETVPRAYRRVLDALAVLDALGARREASRYRQSAIRTYSRAWNAGSQRQLEEILARAEATARDHERRTGLRVA